MTRRERLERKLELRQDWAAKRTAKANVVFEKAEHYRGDHAFNTQPGHIPERARLIKAEDRAFADMDMAKHHESCAKGIETALDKSIFSDDSDAVEALEQRIAEREAEREQMKLVNKLYRKGDAAGLAAIGKDLEQMRARLKDQLSWMQVPYPAYELSNLGGRITADRKRLEYIKQQSARKAKAEESPNGVTVETGENWNGYCRVTFAEKPDREILNALRSAGFSWGAGSWSGKTDQLPKEVKEMAEAKQELPLMACQQCGLETVDVRKRFDGLQLCNLCDSEPTYSNQLRKARELMAKDGREALDNPHAMIGRTCGCGTCFCCAAAEVLRAA